MDKGRKNTSRETENERNDRQSEQQKLTVNPNPRANENIRQSDLKKEPDNNSAKTGSEITDGEAG